MPTISSRLPAADVLLPTHPQILRQMVDERLQEKVRSLAGRIQQAQIEQINQVMVEFAERPGKRIRPLLYLRACEIFGQDEPGRFSDLVSIATGMELLHAFVLIHDDVIDRSLVRRGRPSFHRAIQLKIPGSTGLISQDLAIVYGDLLFALGQKCVADTSLSCRSTILSRLLDYVLDTGFGEVIEIMFGTRAVSSIDCCEIENMYLLKTTKYTFECPLVLAGLTYGIPASELEQLEAIATPAGLAFQIHNDLKEFSRCEAGMIESDLTEGKKTLLLKFAHERLGDSDRRVLESSMQEKNPTRNDLAELVRLIRKSGAPEELEGRMAKLFRTAVDASQSAIFPKEYRDGLLDLLEIVRRLIQTP